MGTGTEPAADSKPRGKGDNPRKPLLSDLDDDIGILEDATDEKLEFYDMALSYRRDCIHECEELEDRVRWPREFMVETVALDLREKYFDPEDSIAPWFWALEDNVGEQ